MKAGFGQALWTYRDRGDAALGPSVPARLLGSDRLVSQISESHIGLGEHERALKVLEKAHADRSGLLVYLKVEPMFDALR
jgi:hypothetical protein